MAPEVRSSKSLGAKPYRKSRFLLDCLKHMFHMVSAFWVPEKFWLRNQAEEALKHENAKKSYYLIIL